MVRIAAALPAPGSIIAVLALIGLLIPSTAEAAYVQWIRCPYGRGGRHRFDSLWPTSSRVRLLSSNNSIAQDGVRLEFDIRADYTGNATCAELLKDSPSDVALRLEALDLSETYVVRPSNWTCLSFKERPAWEQHPIRDRLDRASEIRLVAQHDLGALGVLPAFSTQLSFSASNKSDPTLASSACIYSEITPQLREDVSAAVRYAPIAIFLLVFVSGLLATILAPAAEPRRRPSAEAVGNEGHQQHIVQRAILPGVGDCLLYLQFVFFLGALTLRYPGFYQPLTSLFHWSALFSPTGPFGQERRYDSVNDGIYEINGTLTGSYGLELMSQITGGPMTMDVWRNMVAIAAIITAVVAVLRLLHRFLSQRVPSLSYSSPADKGPGGVIADSAIAHEIWNVLHVVLSYFLTPIVAISAYQLDNVILPTYHLALASMLIVLVVVSVTWMWRIAPSNQLGVLLLDSSKRYRRVGGDDSDSDSDAEPGWLAEKRDIFAVIFFGLAFVRGVAVGGLQFSPLAQVVVLGVTELALLISTAVLRPLRRRVLSVFTWSGVARLVVVALTVVFLPELDASISTRSRAGIAILVIHAAVLVLGCAVPATIRLTSLVYSSRAPANEPEIYGLSQLRRRSDVVNNLSSPIPSIYNPTRPDSPISHHGHSPRSPSDGSSINFYADQDSSPDALYLRAVPRHHYFRPPRSSLSSLRRPHATSLSNISSLPPSSTSSTTTTTSTSEPRSSSSPEAEGGSPTTITPLAPQWSDYSFREADLYYGHGRRPRRAETVGHAATPAAAATSPAATAAATESAPVGRQPLTVSRVLSSVRDQLKGRTSMSVERQPYRKGFEVRRPPRPADC